jgi:hypothetical protein
MGKGRRASCGAMLLRVLVVRKMVRQEPCESGEIDWSLLPALRGCVSHPTLRRFRLLSSPTVSADSRMQRTALVFISRSPISVSWVLREDAVRRPRLIAKLPGTRETRNKLQANILN